MIQRASIILVAFAVSSVTAGTLKFGIRSFPHKDHDGREVANELQFIDPSRISSTADNGAYYEITSLSPLFINNDDIITVSYSTDAPDAGDWIGAYSPPDVDILKTVPVKYGWCDHGNSAQTYYSNGTGSLRFNMTNLRAGIRFYYFRNSTKYPVMTNFSEEIVNFINVNEQLRPRVTASGDPDILQLSWSSNMSLTPTLRWGTVSGGEYPHIVPALTSTIQKNELCGGQATGSGWRGLGEIHTAKFVGMKALANTKVYYSFGDANTAEWSKEFTLFVPPLAGTQPPTRPTQVILYDDMGRGSTDDTYTYNEYGKPAVYLAQQVAAEVQSGAIDMIYHGGDISYATGYLAVWDFYMDMISPIAASVPYLSTVGNHESDWYNSASYYSTDDSGGECGVVSTELLLEPAPATTNQPWWSYDVGLIHFVGMSTEHNSTVGSAQWLWLEADLMAVDRKKTPWIIFGGHRAMYINSNYGGTVTSDIVVMDYLITNVEPLLKKYRVNIGFWGHNHAYQRMTAVYDYEVVQRSTPIQTSEGNASKFDKPSATVHFVIGTAGAGFTKNFISPYPDWCELVFYKYGYARVTAVNASYLEWRFMDTYNTLQDFVIITQNASAEWVTDSVDSSDALSGAVIGIIVACSVVGVALIAFAVFKVFMGQSLIPFGSNNSVKGEVGLLKDFSSNKNIDGSNYA